ncbi:MAG TPA: PH domain-containing protein [Candidatus Polarisedimenticolaceae bacterium]
MIFDIERPDPKLLTYYVLSCLLTGPLFFILIVPNYFRYHTMRFRFDDEGISMRWGILFRREIHLTYARIQDIHLVSNFVERWLGLARIQIQTASGSSKAEMTLEGILQYERVRDFIYSKMRGFRSGGVSAPAHPDTSHAEAIAPILKEIASELRAIRARLEGGADRV